MSSEPISRIPDEGPVLPPPLVGVPPDVMELGEFLQKEFAMPGKEATFLDKVSEISVEVRNLFKDFDIRLLMLDLFATTSKLSRAVGESGAVPYMNLLYAPTYLSQATKKANARFQMMHDAIAVGNQADTYFWGAKTCESVGGPVLVLGKTAAGIVELAGALEKAACAMIFTFVLPIILVIVGLIGGVAQIFSLVRNANALKQFEKKAEGSKNDLGAIVKTLEYLQGPMRQVMREDIHTDQATRDKLHVEHKSFKDSHFSSTTRYKAIQERIEKLQMSDKIKSAPEKFKKIPGWEELFYTVRGLEGLYQDLVSSKSGDEMKMVEQLIALYEQLEQSSLQQPEIVCKMIRENKEELLSLKKEGHDIVELARADMHRAIFYNALFLLMAVLILVDSTACIVEPGHPFIYGGLGIAAIVLEIMVLLFDKKVTPEQFLELERYLKIAAEKQFPDQL